MKVFSAANCLMESMAQHPAHCLGWGRWSGTMGHRSEISMDPNSSVRQTTSYPQSRTTY